MTKADIQHAICQYLSTRFGIMPDQLTDEARFQEDLGLDSLEVTEMLLSIEDETGAALSRVALAAIDEVTSISAMASTLSGAMSTAPSEVRNHDQAVHHPGGQGYDPSR